MSMDDLGPAGALPVICYAADEGDGRSGIISVGGALHARWHRDASDGGPAWLLAAIADSDRAALLAPTGDGGRMIRLRDDDGHWHDCKLRVVAGDGAERYRRFGLITEDADFAAASAAGARFEAYARLSSDWYWEQDAEYRFTFFSREFEEIAGMPAARGIGRTRWNSLREGDLGGIDWPAHIRVVEAHEVFRDFEYPSRRPDGRVIWFRVSGQPRFDADGRFAGYLGVASEVSAAKRMESQLAQAERLSSLGQLAAGVAHEINNPLGFVQSNLGTLQHYFDTLAELLTRYESIEDACADATALDCLRREKERADLGFLLGDAPQLIAESADGLTRIRKIVASLREFAREGRPAWETVDLNACLDNAIELAAAELSARAVLTRDYGQLPPVACMPGVLNMVFLSLLTNAAQAIDQPPGQVRVHTALHGDDHVMVEIADSGHGIAAEHLPHIFDPFFTTRAIGQGQGLGLSACFGIVARHHGRIEAHSEPGQGACFRIVLPIAQRD